MNITSIHFTEQVSFTSRRVYTKSNVISRGDVYALLAHPVYIACDRSDPFAYGKKARVLT